MRRILKKSVALLKRLLSVRIQRRAVVGERDLTDDVACDALGQCTLLYNIKSQVCRLTVMCDLETAVLSLQISTEVHLFAPSYGRLGSEQLRR